MLPKTQIYIDGFNLYYGAVKNTPYKWLNLRRMCELLLPKNDIIKIKYFTAIVGIRKGDPDQPNRQQVYLRALRTIPDIEIIYGRFLSHTVSMCLAEPIIGSPKFVNVIKTEEKGSDVNLATHLINDGYKKQYDTAVLITNDSDLAEPVRIVRSELNLNVGILNPRQDRSTYSLRQYASFAKPIRKGVLNASQFPDVLVDTNGSFHKPSTW